MTQELKAIVWDLDGVLSITERKHSEAKIETLRRWVDAPVDLQIEEVTQKYAGISSEKFFEEMFEEYGREYNSSDCEQAAEEKREMVQQLIKQDGIDPVPGAQNVVVELHNAGYRQCVASSSPMNHIENVVNALELADYFEHFTSAKEVGVGKPDPAVYQLAAERLGIPTQNCLAIEDSPNGIKSATRAGMICIGYGSNEVDDADAHYITDSLETLNPETILSIYNKNYNSGLH
jgi:HAD superfamily hydrolase (TIGR01509 family)